MQQCAVAPRRILWCCWLVAATLAPAAAQQIVPPDLPVSIDEAIQIALQNRVDVISAEEALTISRLGVVQARAGTLPTVTGRVGYSVRGNTDLGGVFGRTPGGNIVTSDQGPQPSVGLSQTVFDAGQTTLQTRQARVGVHGAQSDLQGTRNDVALLVSQRYTAQLRAQAVLALRIEQVRQSEIQLQDVLVRIEVGRSAAVDRFNIEALLAQSVVERETAENDLRVASTNLRNTLALPPGPPLHLVEPIPDPTAPLQPLAELMRQAMEQRPDVVSAEADLKSQEIAVQLAQLRRRPLPNGTLAFNVTPRNEGSRSDFAVGTSVTYPIFDAGVTRAALQIARANARVTAARLEQVKKDVAAQVEIAYFNYVSALQRVQSSVAAVRAADANLQAVNERFRLGAAGITTVDLVQAQVQFFQANNSLVQAKYDITTALAQLFQAIGRTS